MPDVVDIDIKMTQTQTAFAQSTADENLLTGPRGEGKSTAGVLAMTYHAQQQPPELLPMPWVIIRDTFENLKNSTLKAIMKSPIAAALVVSNGKRTLKLPGLWEAEMFGIDSLGDISRLQGMELAGQWFEECAPAAEGDIGGGVQADAYDVGLTSLRAPCNYTRSQITQNFPDEDHWTAQRFVFDIDPMLSTAYFQIPRFENPHIAAADRIKWERQLKNRPDLMKRLVLGEFGYVQIGQAVTPEFDRILHVAKEALTPFFEKDLYMGWDFGLNPSLVICQPSPQGYLHVLDCIVGYGMSLKDFILQMVKPLLALRYPWFPHYYIHMPDPAGNTREQSTGATAWDLLLDNYPGEIIPAQQWPAAREAVKGQLTRRVDDTAYILFDPVNCKPLLAALRGGWHYKKLPSGQIMRDKPVKDKHSHPADAFAGMVELVGDILVNVKKESRRSRSRRGERQPLTFDHIAGDIIR